MFIFYDFETSSRDLVGQILSYAFVVTDQQLTPIDSFTGLIKLNRTQFPEVQAILTNKINITQLQQTGLPEHQAAHNIFNFLNSLVAQYKQCTLVGFNSNQFDLSFLRNLLIRYGFNPYFKGKINNLDILHWTQYLAFQHPQSFPWVQQQSEKSSYYSFRLEDLTQATNILTEQQSHNALEDVLLTIDLVKYFQHTFNESLNNFTSFYLPNDLTTTIPITQKQRHFAALDTTPEKYIQSTYLPLSINPKNLLLIRLDNIPNIDTLQTLSEQEKLQHILYVNPNKAFFHGQTCSSEQIQPYQDLIAAINSDPFYQSIQSNPGNYFNLIKKNWDIEFQIHELGFEHITTLLNYKIRYFKDKSSYPSLLNELLSKRKTPKDDYLIQLFNRLYLNTDPNPNPNLLNRYLKPRYIDGTLTKDTIPGKTFTDMQTELTTAINTCTNDNDLILLQAIQTYADDFKRNLLVTQQ